MADEYAKPPYDRKLGFPLDNLPEPEVLAAEIVENLRSALHSFEAVTGD